ncbi:DUF4132 domain-containing protein [Neptuniibacter sp. PT8_73]|uniref:DUF4132 domain-containing protein n=1 Tax=Neptuniibacter sp. PT8_73 TaxID=3398206 RepID=UPI0039F5322F
MNSTANPVSFPEETRRNIIRLIENGPLEDVIGICKDYPILLSNQTFFGQFKEYSLFDLSIKLNSPLILNYLVAEGAEPKSDLPKDHPLNLALTSKKFRNNSNIDFIKKILEMGFDMPLSSEEECLYLAKYVTPELFSCGKSDLILSLAHLGLDFPLVEQKSRISLVAQAIKHQKSKLIEANVDKDIAHLLIDLGCVIDPVNDSNYSWDSPIGAALHFRRHEILELLLEKGALPELVCHYTDTIISNNHLPNDLKTKILKSLDLSKTDKYGQTLLQSAIEYNQVNTIGTLLESGADINQLTSFGTPLTFAIDSYGIEQESIQTLIDNGADINKRNEQNATALDIALSIKSNKRMVRFLQKNGAKTSIEICIENNEHGNAGCLASLATLLKPDGFWVEIALDEFSHMNKEVLYHWHSLILHCLPITSSKPTDTWLDKAEKIVLKIGSDNFVKLLEKVLPTIKQKQLDTDNGYRGSLLEDTNTAILKGLLWLSPKYARATTPSILRELAKNMFKKVYGYGIRNAKIANAALYSLANLPDSIGIKEIVTIRATTKYNAAQIHINRIFEQIAEERGLSIQDLEDMAVSDYGLTSVGKLSTEIGNFTAHIEMISVGKTELSWVVGEKRQKTAPKDLRDNCPDEIKALKALVKDLNVASNAHSLRIEAKYYRHESMSYINWLEKFINHHLIGFMGQKLIWFVQESDSSKAVIYSDGIFVNSGGLPVEIAQDAIVTLWHPAKASAEETLRWRDYLISNEITQPFKQAHREIYLLTDAEKETEIYSVRFSNHVIRQAIFHALAEERGWKQNKGGAWDGGNENWAERHIKSLNLAVIFEATAIEEYGLTNTGMYDCVNTGNVRFVSKDDHGTKTKLVDIPSIVFSEVMRDIDLFVGIANIGNDPERYDIRGSHWYDSSFGELSQIAQTRPDVLRKILPNLKIGNQLQIKGNFLEVKGKIREYKIHLGSSNILMKPNDSYLCIVEKRKPNNIYLPFDGDKILSLILSKAFLLANDDKIKDKVIISQLRGRT